MEIRTPRTRRSVLVALAALAMMVVLSACQPPYEGPTGATRVAVVGDSLTEWGQPQIHAALGTKQRTVTGVAGIDLARGRKELVQPAVASAPDVLVVELGVNSALDGWTGGDLVPLEGIIKDAASVPCVIWVTPDVISSPYYDAQGPGTLMERIAQMRTSITKRLPTHPNMHLADWGAEQRMNPQWFSSNGLHLTTTGSAALGAFIDAAVDAHC